MTDQKLIAELKSLRSKEREVVTQVLRHLREVETRKLHLARGFSSMFTFCTGELGYSEDEAQIRIQAMRLTKIIPAIEAKIEAGRLSLSVVSKAQSYFRRANLGTDEKVTLISQLEGASARQADRLLAARFPDVKPREKIRSISEELTEYRFAANKILSAKLEKLKGLLAHKNFDGRLDVLIEQLADIALKKLERFDAAVPVTCQVKRTRYIPVANRRVVWQNAQGQCQYIDPATSQRCDSRHGLQVDHVREFSKGGRNEVENLQLLCGAHNRWRSQDLGADILAHAEALPRNFTRL